METLRRDSNISEKIYWYNKYLMSLDIEKLPIGLFCGKMGLCIYFFHQARITKDKVYYKFALRLLNSIYENINTKTLTGLEDGLIGICLGINYLIEEKFQKGNVNSILKDLDSKIFKSFYFNQIDGGSSVNEDLYTILEVAFYYTYRLKNSSINKNERFILENLIIKAINKIENSYLNTKKYTEPMEFSLNGYFLPNYLLLLSQIYELNFYNYKICRILNELYLKLITILPSAQSNRILLIAGMRVINKYYNNIEIEHHMKYLESTIDVNNVIEVEFKDKNIFLANGVTGLYFILKNVFRITDIKCEQIAKKIANSDAWDYYLNDKNKRDLAIGLFTGFSGAILMFQDINNQL